MFAECSRCPINQYIASILSDMSEKDLTILALPHKVGLALTTADLVLLVAAHRYPVGMCFAA